MAPNSRITAARIAAESTTNKQARVTTSRVSVEYAGIGRRVTAAGVLVEYTRFGKSNQAAFMPAPHSEGNIPSYIEGEAASIPSIPAYLKGQSTASSNQPTYIGGQISTKSSKHVYTKGGTGATPSSKPAYTEGSSARFISAYLKGNPDKLTIMGYESTGATFGDYSKHIHLSVPAETSAGDLLVAYIGIADLLNDVVIIAPAGWTLYGTYEYSRGEWYGRYLVGVYYRTADGTEASTYTWSWTAAEYYPAGAMIAFAAPENKHQVGEIVDYGDQANGGYAVALPVTAFTNNSILMHVGIAAYAVTGITDPLFSTAYTNIVGEFTPGSSSGELALEVSYIQVSSSGDKPHKSMLWDPDEGENVYMTFTLHVEIQESLNAWGKPASSIPAYMPVPDLNGWGYQDAYTSGINTKIGNITAYLSGYNTDGSSKTSYSFGVILVKSNTSVFCSGTYVDKKDSIHAYVPTMEFKSNISAYIGESLEGESMVQPYITLADSTGTTVCNFRVIHEGYTDGEMEKAGSVEPTIGGGVDVSMGAIRRKWEPIVKVYGTASTVDEAGFGTRSALEYFFELNNPNGTPSNVITCTDHHGVGRSVFMIDTLQANLLTTLVEGSGAVFHVKIRMIEANS
jgi:hypothetical protein